MRPIIQLINQVLFILIVSILSISKAWGQPVVDHISFVKGLPIWVDEQQTTKNLTVSFRGVIDYNNESNVLLRIAASSDYRAFVNGKFLGHGPCVAGTGYYRVDELKLDQLLKSGKNIIAIEVAGYNVDNYYLLNQPSFLQAEVVNSNKVLIATQTHGIGNRFDAAILNQRIQEVPKYSFQRTFIEVYQLSPGYQAWTKDLEVPFATAKLEQTDRKALIGRRVKYPDYTIRKYTKTLPNQVYQFECNSTGFIGTTVQVTQPSVLTLSWDEILTDGDVDRKRQSCNSSITYRLQPGSYQLESFEPYTLQYLKVIVEEGDCKVSDPYIRQYVNSDVSKALFSCNDQKLNTIYKAAVETFKQNALDIFMDCPSRERAGWLCDSYFTSRVAFDLSGNTLIEKNFLENYLLPEKFDYIPEGMLPMCYPSEHSDGIFIPNWAMWFVLQLEEYAQRSGDYQMVKDLQPKVMALLKYFEGYKNEDGLLEKLEKWIFVEWSEANNLVLDVNYPTNMLYAKTLEVAGRLYNNPELLNQANHIREVIRKQAFDGTFFVDHAMRENDKLVVKSDRTEVCQYYAFFLDIATPESHPQLWKILLNDFGPKRKKTKAYPETHPANAFIGNYLRLEILSRYGHAKQLLSESIDEFLHMANLTGTLWENVNTAASCNHGFASHVAHVFYRDLLGINKIDTQRKLVSIVFNESDLISCKGIIPTGDQVVELQWEKKGKKLLYKLITPTDYQVDIKNNTSLQPVRQ